MITFISSKDKFWNFSPAAGKIFAYLRENIELASGPWGFESGSVACDRKSTHATFSYVALSGWGKDQLDISATMTENGVWRIKHTITRAA
jgi:hypothetical protein